MKIQYLKTAELALDLMQCLKSHKVTKMKTHANE